MRIDHLKIAEYRNLRAFEIDFDETQSTTVVLGRNGSGKSNLFEAIVEIFRDLESGAPPAFAYTIAYTCNDHKVLIDADPAREGKHLELTVDGKSLTKAAFQKDLQRYLPKYVFAYYSGWSSRLERHYDRPTRKHYEGILKAHNDEIPLRRMFFCRKEYSQLVLLAFFLAQTENARELLRKYLNIKSFDSALFVLKTPWWRGTGTPSKIQQSEGDRRFWYARGAFKGFLERLWSSALAPIRNDESVERDVRRQGEKTERLYLFLKNEEQLAALKRKGDHSKELFGYLESLFLCDLIDEVRVTVERTDGTRVKFTQMSEGEQQLLTVLGLLLFTQNDESLYLLDEPDTHLNPLWTYDYLKLLQDNLHAEKGQLIVATHNPLMIGSLRRNQVRILEMVTAEGITQTTAVEPETDPFALGVDGLLTSEIYGLTSVLPKEVVEKIHLRNQLFAEKHRTAQQNQQLTELSDELARLGVARSYDDPYEREFVEAMARRRKHTDPTATMSAEELRARNAAADELLAKLFAEEDGGK